MPATEGNSIQVLRNGGQIFPALLDAIRSADATVDFLTFVYPEGIALLCAERHPDTVAGLVLASVGLQWRDDLWDRIVWLVAS